MLMQAGVTQLRNRYAQLIFELAGKQISVPKTLGFTYDFDIKNIKGSNRAEFFTGTRLAGGSSLDTSYRKPEGEHSIITAIKLLDADNTTETTVGSIPWVPGANNAQLQNARLTVVSNGITYVKNLPVNSMIGVAEQAESGTLALPVPVPWIAQTELVVSLSNEDDFTNTNEVFAQIGLIGVGTIA